MNFLIALGHPAHYHLFKFIKKALINHGHYVMFVITPKDILRELLELNDEQYEVLAEREKKASVIAKGKKLIYSTKTLCKLASKYKADLLVGCLSQIAYAGRIKHIPSIFIGEDDFSYTWIQGLITYPLINCILAPQPTNTGPFIRKRISYDGYQKLAYLHPNYFSKTRNKANNSKKILIRLVNLGAYHDVSAEGLNKNLINDFICSFKNEYKITISSEKVIPEEFEEYKIRIDSNSIHEELLNSSLFIGDSQSMAVEASLLGVPNIRINNFAGKISILNELERKYQLTVSIHPRDANNLINIAQSLLNSPVATSIFNERKDKMLSEKIDVTAFMVWFIENYPESVKIMKENPDYQYNFK